MSKVTLGPDFATFDLLRMHHKIISHLDHSISFLAHKASLKLISILKLRINYEFTSVVPERLFTFLKVQKKGLKNDR